MPQKMQIKGRLWIHTGKDTPLSRETLQQFQAHISPDKEAARVPVTDMTGQHYAKSVNLAMD